MEAVSSDETPGSLPCLLATRLGKSHYWWPPSPKARTNLREAQLRQAQACNGTGSKAEVA